MSKAQEIMKQLMESKDQEALASEENLRKALGERGCDPEEIDGILAGFNGFPLDDSDLDDVAGGGNAKLPLGTMTEHFQTETPDPTTRAKLITKVQNPAVKG